MSSDPLAVLPVSVRDPARSALTSAFGRQASLTMLPIQGGASGALTYRIETGDRPYLLRIETARDPLRDPRRSYVCMRAAAEAGLAPPLHHADAEAGIAIMDFIEQRPLSAYPGGPDALGTALGGMIGRLQATPTFPALMDYGLILTQLLESLLATGRFPAGAFAPHLEAVGRIRDVYPFDPTNLVSSHNDHNAGNLLFDGDRLWLIDWETAFRNDPIADIGLAAINFASIPGVEEPMLRAWLGRDPDSLVRAQLAVMKAMALCYYGGVMLTFPRPDAPAQDDLAAPALPEFGAMAARGELPADRVTVLHLLGKTMLRTFLEACAAPGFDKALATAGQG